MKTLKYNEAMQNLIPSYSYQEEKIETVLNNKLMEYATSSDELSKSWHSALDKVKKLASLILESQRSIDTVELLKQTILTQLENNAALHANTIYYIKNTSIPNFTTLQTTIKASFSNAIQEIRLKKQLQLQLSDTLTLVLNKKIPHAEAILIIKDSINKLLETSGAPPLIDTQPSHLLDEDWTEDKEILDLFSKDSMVEQSIQSINQEITELARTEFEKISQQRQDSYQLLLDSSLITTLMGEDASFFYGGSALAISIKKFIVINRFKTLISLLESNLSLYKNLSKTLNTLSKSIPLNTSDDALVPSAAINHSSPIHVPNQQSLYDEIYRNETEILEELTFFSIENNHIPWHDQEAFADELFTLRDAFINTTVHRKQHLNEMNNLNALGRSIADKEKVTYRIKQFFSINFMRDELDENNFTYQLITVFNFDELITYLAKKTKECYLRSILLQLSNSLSVNEFTDNEHAKIIKYTLDHLIILVNFDNSDQVTESNLKAEIKRLGGPSCCPYPYTQAIGNLLNISTTDLHPIEEILTLTEQQLNSIMDRPDKVTILQSISQSYERAAISQSKLLSYKNDCQKIPSFIITLSIDYPLTTAGNLFVAAGIIALCIAVFAPQSLPHWLAFGLYNASQTTHLAATGATIMGLGCLLTASMFSTDKKGAPSEASPNAPVCLT